MHGARGGAKSGEAHPNYRHGERSLQAEMLRGLVNRLVRGADDLDCLDNYQRWVGVVKSLSLPNPGPGG